MHTAVILACVTDVEVGADPGEEAGDSVSIVRQVHTQLGVGEFVECAGLLQQQCPHAGLDPTVVCLVQRRDVGECIEDVHYVLVPLRVVPSHYPVFGNNTQRVRPTSIPARIPLPGQPPEIPFRGRSPAPEGWHEELGCGSRRGHSCCIRPRPEVLRNRRIQDVLERLPMLGGTLGIKEVAARSIARPRTGWIAGIDNARQLEPRVEAVIVDGALGPVCCGNHRRAGMIDADVALGPEAALYPVHVEDRSARRQELCAERPRCSHGDQQSGRHHPAAGGSHGSPGMRGISISDEGHWQPCT